MNGNRSITAEYAKYTEGLTAKNCSADILGARSVPIQNRDCIADILVGRAWLITSSSRNDVAPTGSRLYRRLAIGALSLLLTVRVFASAAQLQLAPDKKPIALFSGEARSLPVIFRNPTAAPVSSEVRMRLVQTSSATAAPFADLPWKRLEVLPGQTVLESARLDLPAVRAETRFLVQWIAGSNQVVGISDLLVYPTNLLRDLKPWLADTDLGVFEPHNQLKPLLRAVGIESVNLQELGLDRFFGRLAIIGPFHSKEEMPGSLTASVKALARKGTGIVWIQPPRSEREPLQPSFYSVPEGKGAVVIAQAELLENLEQNPQAQLNLIQLATLAVRPEPPHLPDLTAK